MMQNARSILIVSIAVVVWIAMSIGCVAVKDSGGWHTSESHTPIVSLRIAAVHNDRLECEWKLENRTNGPIWVPFKRPIKFRPEVSLSPQKLILPHRTLLLAFSEYRLSDEQYREIQIEEHSMPGVAYVKVSPGGQVGGSFDIETPLYIGPESLAASIFLFRSDYENIQSFGVVNERSETYGGAEKVMLAVEYWRIDPKSGIPDTKGAYSRIYWESLAHQAVWATKYPANRFRDNEQLVARVAVTSKIAYDVAFVDTVTVFYAPPARIDGAEWSGGVQE